MLAPKNSNTLIGTSSYWLMKLISCLLQVVRSSVVNPYGMFHPMGPNFRRSWITAWKKQNENNNFLNVSGLFDSVMYSSVNPEYDRSKFALNPLGGSLVIFTPICSTCTGKAIEGMEVSQRRKLLLMLSGLNCSTMASSRGIHEIARWQFCSKTQLPEWTPFSIRAAALGPCPCPSEIGTILDSMSCLIASAVTSAIGSEPDERIKIKGTIGVESRNHVGRSNGGTRRYSRPSFASTISWIAVTVASVRSANMVNAFCSGLHFCLKFFGHSTSAAMGSSESNTAFHPSRFAAKSAVKPSNASFRVVKVCTRAHDTSVSQSEFSGFGSVAAPGKHVSSMSSCVWFSSLSVSWHFKHNINEYSSLSFAKRLRHTMSYSLAKNERNSSCNRSSFASLASARCTDTTNCMMNQSSENSYIGSTIRKSEMMKNSAAHRKECGVYETRVSAIVAAVISCTFTCSPILVEVIFDDASVLISSSSSRMSPDDADSSARILFSISASSAFDSALSITS
mmetsp:Transcript_19771/g.49774  ORF Transcript_19771/g.49774 Transcript_19771/m.49774 type:complete len:509 (+) Transcript_19771:1999-3525(+)